MPSAALVNFTAGETSPKSRGRFDLAWFQSSCEKLLNFIPEIPGPARFRSGFKKVRITRAGAVARLIPFQLNKSTGYMLEFTNGKMRVYKNGDLLQVSRTTTTAITKANPAVITVASTANLANGDEVIITDIVGMEELNGRQVKLANNSGSTYELVDPVTGSNINSSSFGTYSSGGTLKEVYEIDSPYLLADLDDISFAPSAINGVAYLACVGYAPRKLSVASDVFTLATFTRTNDPFTGAVSDLGTVIDDFQSADLAAWTTSGTVRVTNCAWNGDTDVSEVPFPSWALASSANAVVGDYIGYISIASTVAYGTWQYTVGSSCGTRCGAASGVLDTNYSDFWFLVIDANNYYRSRIYGPNGNHISLVKVAGGVSTVISTAALPLNIRSNNTGQKIRISRDTSGNFTIRCNGTIVLTATDTTHTTSATMRMYVGTSGNSNEVAGTDNSIAWYNIGVADPVQNLVWVDDIYATTDTAEEYPIAVGFYESRLCFFGTDVRPNSTFMSCAPDDDGNPRYENFTGGTEDDAACFFALAPVNGQVDYIAWGQGTSRFLYIGTYGGLHRVAGSGIDEPITPGSINAKQIDGFGCEPFAPAGSSRVFWLQRGGTALRTIRYNQDSDDVESYDLTLNAEQISYSRLQRVALQVGKPDILWVVREDGILCGISVQGAENVAGWHRHKIGGTSAKVIDVQVLSRTDKDDQLWIVAERSVNGTTIRTVEVMADPPSMPDLEDFYSGSANKTADTAYWGEVMYRRAEEYIHQDAAATYNGSDRGTAAGATLTPGQTGTGAGVTFTASAAVFKVGDIGKELWKKPDRDTGVGSGKATITAFTDSTHVTCTITEAFDAVTAIDAGDWYFTATTIYGVWHLEGATSVVVVADGKVIADGGLSGEFSAKAVSAGKVTLSVAAAVVHIGLPYEGLLKSHNLSLSAAMGPSLTKPRIISHMNLRFLQSLGARFGTSLYDLAAVDSTLVGTVSGRAATLFSGVRPCKAKDGWESWEGKYVYVSQRRPLPCIVQGIELRYDTTEDA